MKRPAPLADSPTRQFANRLTSSLARPPIQLALLVAFELAVVFPLTGQLSPDESGQLGLCRQPLGVIVTSFQQAQNHPLFAVLAHGALELFPDSVYAFRAPAIVAGLLLPLAFYFTERRRGGAGLTPVPPREAVLVIAVLLVVVDPLRYYATAGRGYSMLALWVVLMNHLLLRYVDEPKPRYLIFYGLVTIAACYTHLFAVLVVAGHAVCLVTEMVRSSLRRRGGESGVRDQALGIRDASRTRAFPTRQLADSPTRPLTHSLAVLFAATGIALLLYLPMLPEIRDMAGTRRGTYLFLGLFGSLLELFRFANWTLGAFVLLVPIFLEGAARQLNQTGIDRRLRLHLTVIASVIALVLIAQPSNFGSRFLIGVLPSAASLGAWALSSYWSGSPTIGKPRLPVTGTWLIGFGLGVLAACAPMSHNIPVGAHLNSAGEDQGYYHRALPRAIGKTGGCMILLSGVLTTALLPRKCVRRVGQAVFGAADPGTAALAGPRVAEPPTPPPPPYAAGSLAHWLTRPLALWPVFWTVVVVFCVVPLALGTEFFSLPWPVELHTVAVATLSLLAWRYRFQPARLYALRYALLVAAAIVLVWQFRMDVPPITLRWLTGWGEILPAAAILIGVSASRGEKDSRN